MQPRSTSAKAFIAATSLLFGSFAVHADPIDDLIKKGDAMDVKLQAAGALEQYQQAEKLNPKDAQILVRIARQYRHLMADAPAHAEKLRLGAIALNYGQRAAALAPNDSDAQLSCAITYGKMVPFQGKKDQMAASLKIREAAERAVRLDPKNDLAWHVLGKWHRVIADVGSVKLALASMMYDKLPPGSNADAVNCLQKAIALNPGRLMHYIELGRTFAQMGKAAEARRFLEKGLAMPNTDKDDAEVKSHGRQALASLR
jgi:tetratricopeptide (TPR) repeat protein